jgi:L-ascorbate metabolism protein UlaG (beta-lactamase superfamily)
MEIKWHGHSCFELTDGNARVLIDPFLKPNNPVAEATAEDVDATHVLITHGHADHIADAVPVAKRTGAAAVAHVEVAKWLEHQGLEDVHDPNLGGTVSFDWGWVKLVQAFHTNTMPGSDEAPFSAVHGVPVGQAAGLVVNIGGVTVYHAGDTCLFGDMALIAKRTPIDVAILPIGGHYTMDRHDAAHAAELIGAPTVLPCHYNTFPLIETDAQAFKQEVESSTSSRVEVLEPGGTWSS